MSLQLSVELDRKETMKSMRKFDDLEDNAFNWQKVSVADAKSDLRTEIVEEGKRNFDYYGNSQLNEKDGQMSLAGSYFSTVNQLGQSRGRFRSGLELDVFYDAPHAIHLEEGTKGPYKIFPDGPYALRFDVQNPSDYEASFKSANGKVAYIDGRQITIEAGLPVQRKKGEFGYDWVRQGVANYWAKEAGNVDRDVMRIILDAGFRLR